MSRPDSSTEPAVVWPVVVLVGTDDPDREAQQLVASRLPRDAKRALWRHLKHASQDLSNAIQNTVGAFPGSELRVTLTGRGKRIQDILKTREGKGDAEPTQAAQAA
jgi:hypothetical protein